MRNLMSYQAPWLTTPFASALLFGFLLAGYAYSADMSEIQSSVMNDFSSERCQEAAAFPQGLRVADFDRNYVLDATDASFVRSKLFTADSAADLDTSGLVDITDLETVLTLIGRFESLRNQCAGSDNNAGAVFEMVVLPNMTDRFYVYIEDPEMIEHARDLVRNTAGGDPERHVTGTVIAGTQSYNPDWNFHLDPASIQFFESETADCSASISYVEANYDAWCNIVPGCRWCPWTSEVTREVN